MGLRDGDSWGGVAGTQEDNSFLVCRANCCPSVRSKVIVCFVFVLFCFCFVLLLEMEFGRKDKGERGREGQQPRVVGGAVFPVVLKAQEKHYKTTKVGLARNNKQVSAFCQNRLSHNQLHA